MIIGLTGQTGAGKSTVSEFLNKKGFFIIDCDEVSREVTKKGSDLVLKLADAFGKEILDDDLSLNRAKLASVAFSSREKTELLNSITHPVIFKALEGKIKQNGDKTIVLDAPTLFESGAYRLCDKIISVICSEEKRLERIVKRDNLSLDQAKKRINAQFDNDFYTKKSDAVIVNDGDIEDIKRKISQALYEIGVL